jgi:outer membrane protein, heavy metal efflux system
MQWRTCLVALLVAAPAIAQTTASNSLSLQAAMERAFAANPTIAAARLSRTINVAGLAVAGEYLNPDVFVEIEKETPKQAFGFVVPLELGGKRAKRIAVSEATIRTGDAELAATIAQIRNDVRRAYFDVAVAEQRLVILRDLKDLSRRVRDSAQARFESGESPRLEMLQADLAVAAAENEAIAAEAVVIAATSKLNAVLGLPLDTVQQLSTPLGVGGPLATDVVMDLARTGRRWRWRRPCACLTSSRQLR